MEINREEILRLTEQFGGQWGLNHARRLLRLIAIIADDEDYDEDVVWVAAHLHDWGGFSPFSEDDSQDTMKSVELAADYLSATGYPPDFVEHVLECIEFHRYSDYSHSFEAVLIHDANLLDMLGVVGAVRMFVKSERDLRQGYKLARLRRDTIPNKLALVTSRALARERVREMDLLLKSFEIDTFGVF